MLQRVQLYFPGAEPTVDNSHFLAGSTVSKKHSFENVTNCRTAT